MTREDGFSTNPEMLADYSEVSRQLYIGAYNALAGQEIEPGLAGKPIQFLRLYVNHVFDPAVHSLPKGIFNEELAIKPKTELFVGSALPGRPEYEEAPEDIQDYRRSLYKRVMDTAISPGLNIEDVIVPGTIFAAYVAYTKKGDVAHTLFPEAGKPVKARISAATYLAEQALDYVMANGVEHDWQISEKYPTEDEESLNVKFELMIDAELPLNGNEPVSFLLQYLDAMLTYAEEGRKKLAEYEQMKLTLPGVEVLMELQQDRVDMQLAAAERVMDIFNA
jgi:hypothetical protein